MLTKKIIIKDEEHFKEVVKALKSIGETVYCDLFHHHVETLAFDAVHQVWCRLYKSNVEKYNSVPEFEIVTKTSYELKEVTKREIIKIGDNEYYKDELEIALKNINPI